MAFTELTTSQALLQPKTTIIYAIVIKTTFLSRKFVNTRSTKALRVYFALAESQPTCATLDQSNVVEAIFFKTFDGFFAIHI